MLDPAIYNEPDEFRNVDWSDSYGRKVNILPFRRKAIEEVLLGDQRYVTYMFTWANTPAELRNTWSLCSLDDYLAQQGHKARNPINEEQKAFLRWLIRPEVNDKGEE
jgi:hypothetical protein